MKITSTQRYLYSFLLVTMMSLMPVKQLLAHAGTVLFVNGDVTATSLDGKVHKLVRGSKVRDGDIVITGKGAKVQIRAGDGSMISLQEKTTFDIIQHKHSGYVDETNSLVELVKGGMRAVTGLIGKKNPDNYKIKVKQSTIGIRGTEFVIQLCDDDCQPQVTTTDKETAKETGTETATGTEAKAQTPAPSNGVYVGVLSGGVTVATNEKEVDLDASLDVVMGVSMGVSKDKKQYVFIGEEEDAKPETLQEPPKVILEALAPPPVDLSKKQKEKTHSLSPYSGIDTKHHAKQLAATQPVDEPHSAIEDFDALVYPAPDVFIKNRFIYSRYHAVDTFHGGDYFLTSGNNEFSYFR